jgi:enoyl-CoA hydratase/carnithine racemase
MSDILTDTDAAVMTLTLNRVDKKNAITAAMYAAMADEGATFSRMLHEPAAREALTAFTEKRKPDFSRL